MMTSIEQPVKIRAKRDLLEHVGFLKLRMQRSMKLISEQKLGKHYDDAVADMLTRAIILEGELKVATCAKFWKDRL